MLDNLSCPEAVFYRFWGEMIIRKAQEGFFLFIRFGNGIHAGYSSSPCRLNLRDPFGKAAGNVYFCFVMKEPRHRSRITDATGKLAARAFVEEWRGNGYEKGETQRFWISLFRKDMTEPEIVAELFNLYQTLI